MKVESGGVIELRVWRCSLRLGHRRLGVSRTGSGFLWRLAQRLVVHCVVRVLRGLGVHFSTPSRHAAPPPSVKNLYFSLFDNMPPPLSLQKLIWTFFVFVGLEIFFFLDLSSVYYSVFKDFGLYLSTLDCFRFLSLIWFGFFYNWIGFFIIWFRFGLKIERE